MPKTTRTSAPTLRETQQWLRWLITDPRGVAGALENATSKNLRLEIITDAPPVSKTERLDVYAEGYFARLHDNLAEDHEATIRAIGAPAFRRLIAEYLSVFPSKTFSANFVGKDLPRFALKHSLNKTAPYLGSLIELEWLLVDAFFAPNVAPTDLAKLSALTPETAASLKLSLHPATRFLKSDWAIDEFWQSETQKRPKKLKKKTTFAIHRENYVVDVCRLDEKELQTLEKIKRKPGLTLASLCNWLAKHAPDAPMQAWLGQWVKREMVTIDFSGS